MQRKSGTFVSRWEGFRGWAWGNRLGGDSQPVSDVHLHVTPLPRSLCSRWERLGTALEVFYFVSKAPGQLAEFPLNSSLPSPRPGLPAGMEATPSRLWLPGAQCNPPALARYKLP